ncbi:hypothetical protein MARBORIA2_13670 [Methanobrevibacter arboriphilus]|uniref:Uncharacterized protein n=1 Tax=Methanobrevibacter arboriphilus TaxID=39441 RepID=A0ACA8R1I6_METAZ|nr:hypothetical protein [Methanobrevibacter arboriphilus]MCC7562358.1 hypothetical protein [Methanobrevibacter arboriphilus]BBL61128.1 hypothetical protein MarbSA_01680 [Methanobrevibacter arboriphilus]GLI12277.1 hypothetical protein MARBORIA2_13670 [Methanobrevibacter arboriphilus]
MILKNIKKQIEERYIKLLIFLILFKHTNIVRSILRIFKMFNLHNDKRGQLSIEFLLISLISILILVSISLPLTEIAVDSTLSTVKLLETKSEISKITNSIDDVYSDGVGSKRILYVEMPKETYLIFSNDSMLKKGIVTGNLDAFNYSKQIKIMFNADNINSRLNFKKNINYKVTIEWPIETENIILKNVEVY